MKGIGEGLGLDYTWSPSQDSVCSRVWSVYIGARAAARLQPDVELQPQWALPLEVARHEYAHGEQHPPAEKHQHAVQLLGLGEGGHLGLGIGSGLGS